MPVIGHFNGCEILLKQVIQQKATTLIGSGLFR